MINDWRGKWKNASTFMASTFPFGFVQVLTNDTTVHRLDIDTAVHRLMPVDLDTADAIRH